MGLRPVTPTSSWWVLAVGRTRGEKNKGGGWEERRQRRGRRVKGSSGGQLCFNSLTLGVLSPGYKKGQRS